RALTGIPVSAAIALSGVGTKVPHPACDGLGGCNLARDFPGGATLGRGMQRLLMTTRSYLAPVGRFLLAFIFVLSGIFKIATFRMTEGYMASKGLPIVGVLLIIALLIEVVAGVLLMLGYQTQVAALVLFFYLIPVTLSFHNFWSYQGLEAQMQFVNFLKNL